MGDILLFVLAGFLGSYHCLGMCSPIASLAGRGVWAVALYNLGRIFTYGFLGFLSGAFGLYFFRTFEATEGVVRFITLGFGISMVLLGVLLVVGRDRGTGFLTPFYEVVCEAIGSLSRDGRGLSPLLIGLFNGFLPCPMVYAFLVKGASTFSPLKGMVLMGAMGIGTLPSMVFSRVLFGRFLRGGATIGVGVIIVYMGVVSILRSAGLIHH